MILQLLALAAVVSASEIPAPSLPASALPVPIIRQATDYSCGAAALLSTLYYWQQYDADESSLYSRLGTTPDWGTDPDGIVKGARELGLEAQTLENLTQEELKKFLADGATAILDIQAWRNYRNRQAPPWRDEWESGHYVVLVALDDHYAYFMDPSAGPQYAYIPRAELDDRWHDYEMRDGAIRRYQHLAVIVRGKTPLRQFPASLIYIE